MEEYYNISKSKICPPPKKILVRTRDDFVNDFIFSGQALPTIKIFILIADLAPWYISTH